MSLYETHSHSTNMRASMAPQSSYKDAYGSSNNNNQTFSIAPPTTAADTLPTINFGFEDLRDRMSKFTIKFDSYIAEGRKRVLDSRNEHRAQIGEFSEDHKMKERSIEILSVKTQSHATTVAKEAQETTEMRAALATITQQRDARIAHRDRLRGEVASVQKSISQRLEAQRAHAQAMEVQSAFNLPELDFWVDYLCLRIEGVGRADELRFVYTHVDPAEWEREFAFELVLGEHEYRVQKCVPRLEKESLKRVVEGVNDSRDIKVFLREMRQLFVETVAK